MCGVVWVRRKDGRPAYKSVLKRYHKQKSRGTDGYGYVAIEKNKIVAYQRATTEHEIMQLLEKETASEILFHHRNPTSAPNIVETAHPILVAHEKLEHSYLVAHNGVTRNTDTLKKEHEAKGFRYMTELVTGFTAVQSGNHYSNGTPKWNDSESLAVETALTLDGKQDNIGAMGPAAVVGLQVHRGTIVRRFFYRNALNPLLHHTDKVMTTVTSAGHGVEVPTTYIWELHQDGTYGTFGKKLIEPPEYYTGYGNYETLPWYNPKKPDTHTLHLPSGPRKAGFHMDNLRQREDMNFNPDDGDEMQSIEDVIDELAELEFYTGVASDDLITIRTIHVEDLYDEFEGSIGVEKALKADIEVIDDEVETGEASTELFDKKIKYEVRLKDILSYQDALSKEISRREANGEKLKVPTV